ncbi:MFS transporter [Enterococcus gallinarum]|uniref:MFS transporter n=1 Tax=Enterococcus gallinarum TaxID=1353 RepID=UPI001D17CD14|nr:MFS transporter [Enterococcus gallinarum]MCC4045647.1 MFS transporter [Enterococcus gallinarum]
MRKISLLSVSLLVVSAGAIAGNIPAIAQTYPSINPTLIELLTTLPSLFIILTILVSPKIGRKIGYKRTVQLGVGTVLIAGTIPIIVNSFALIFISRILFGIGVGLFNPLLYSIASSLYSGNKLATVIGMQSAFEGIGGMVITFLVGQLLTISWQFSFSVYLIALPILIMFIIFVPDIQPVVFKETELQKKEPVDKIFIKYLILLFIAVTIYMSIAVKVTPLLYFKGIGDATDGSNLLALVGLGAMTAGFLFGKVVQHLKELTIPISFASMGVAMLLLAISPNMLVASIAVTLCGFSFRTFVPYVFNEINQSSKNAELNTSRLLIFFNIGTAFTPITISLLQKVFPFLNQIGLFYGEALLMLFLAILLFIVEKSDSK